MRSPLLAIVAAGLAGCASPAAPAPSPDASPWPDALSDHGDLTMRLRHVPLADAATEEGPALVIEAHLVTADQNVLLAGGPRASVLRPTVALAQGAFDALDEDAWSGRTSDGGRSALVLLPARGVDARPADIEVRARVIRVREWTAYDLGTLGAGRHDGLAAPPYALSVDGHANVLIVGARTPREARGGGPHDRLTQLLPHAWAAQAVEVRDAHGALLEAADEMSTQWGSTVGFRSGVREHRAPIAYPVTALLRVPKAYDVEYPMFHWRAISLPQLPGNGAIAELPPGYRDSDAAKRECAAALAASDPKATPWRRIADVLLRAGVPPLREQLASSGPADSPALLRALDAWRTVDEAGVDRMIAECRRTGDVDRLVVGMMNPLHDEAAARVVDAIADVDPRAALPWLRLERTLCTGLVDGGTESRLMRDDLLRSLDEAIDRASR